MLQRLVAPLAVLLLAALLIWLWPRDNPGDSSAADLQDQAPPKAHQVSAQDQEAEKASAGSTERIVSETPEAQARPAVVRGRCVSAETKAPIAGCTVKFDGRPRNSQAMELHGPVEWKDPDPFVTESDGRFEIKFVPPPPFQHSLDIQAPGRVPRTARWGAFRPGQEVDLGDITMQVGLAVTGRVVDEGGNPVATVGVRLTDLPLRANDGAANNSRGGWSDESGNFTVSVPIPPGTWPLRVSARGFRHIRPQSVRVSKDMPDLVVVVRKIPLITGVAVDELGKPVVRASIEAQTAAGWRCSSWTRKDGTFRLYARRDPISPIVSFRTSGWHGACEPFQEERRVEWGSRDVRLVLRRGLSLEVVVVERGSGKPVERYAVSCHATRATSSSETGARLGGTHEGGQVVVDGIWRGENFIKVFPNDIALLPSERIKFTAHETGIAPLRIEVDRMQKLTVHLSDERNRGVPGSQIEVLLQGTSPLNVESWASNIKRGSSMSLSSDPNYVPHQVCATAKTGSDGTASVFAPFNGRKIALRALGPGHRPFLEKDVTFSKEGQVLRLRAPAGARLTGTVSNRGASASELGVQLQVGRAQIPRNHKPLALAKDGTFVFEDLPIGEGTLWLHQKRGRQWRQIVLSRTKVQLTAGKTTQVSIDVRKFMPGRVTGRALVDGRPPKNASVHLRGASFEGPYKLDEHGRFVARAVQPGTYRAFLLLQDKSRRRTTAIPGKESFKLEPGAQLDRVFVFEHLKLRIRLLQPDGKTPVARTRCYVDGRPLMTDAEGWVLLDPAPRREIRVQVLRGRRFWKPGNLGTVAIPNDKKEAEFQLKLKERLVLPSSSRR